MVSLILTVLFNITDIKAAFTVTHAAARTTSGTIRFTNVITNIGEHYNSSSGDFTCQHPGIYVFLLHIWKASGEENAYCYIRKNGTNTIQAQSAVMSSIASSYDGVSNSVILHLVQGDIVDLGDCSYIGTFYPYSNTSFSGFLLQKD